MRTSILILTFFLSTFLTLGQTKKITKNVAKIMKPVTKFGALAIDRNNGFYYGWSQGLSTQADAEKTALDECQKKGGKCSIVLSFSGSGCAAYRTIDGNVGSAYGWGTAKNKEDADAIATQECMKRSNGAHPSNFVWACNADNSGVLKEIYNATEEIEALVKVGNQVWSNRNLDVSTFRNGDPIPEAKNASEWHYLCKEDKPAFCYLDFDSKNGAIYGKMYNFHAVMDPRGLAPKGMHVPSQYEYEVLVAFLGGKNDAGKKMRSKSAAWNAPSKKYGDYSGSGDNSSGLNFLPGGWAWSNRYGSDFAMLSTVFPDRYGQGKWWTSTIDGPTRYNENGGSYGYYNNGYAFGFSSFKINECYTSSENCEHGFSVRVVKD